ncbi:sensor histidine kinase [Phenylobacterium terrae]|uniref:histidine kinase n=2 Tax=Phenylobacterium terrae TaxID=2665495 RepID=A0ABW4N2K7_9CAUL
MIRRLKAFAKRHWPALRLRTILFLVLFFVAALPGLSAIFLRVYENTLVRQTEAELVAQGAALAAAAEALWPGADPAPLPPLRPEEYRPEPSAIDLSISPILPERPPAAPSAAPDPAALSAARAVWPIARETGRTTLAAIVLLDGEGRVALGRERGSYAALPEVRAALGGRPATVLRRRGDYEPRYRFEWLSRASALRIHHARPVVVNGQVAGVVLLSRSPRALFRGIYQDRIKIGLGIGLIFAALVVLSGLVSRGVTRPIEALSAASRKVAAGQGEIPETPPTAAIEIRALYEDFGAMSEAIARRSRYLRDFAAAVSHEFKTPLAGIAGAVELLEDHGESMSPAERRRFLDNISQDVARLSQLVTRLLDLARADMARPEAGVAVDPGPTLRRVADAGSGPEFKVVLDLPPALPRVAAPEAALETALTTLVENSRQAGASRLTITARAEGEALVLCARDDGPGVPTADRTRLFEPFFTSRRSQGGTGLGLSIARSLLSASHASIDYVESETGARFDVTLPLARD